MNTKETIEIIQMKRPICNTCNSPKILIKEGKNVAWKCYCDFMKQLGFDQKSKKLTKDIISKI